MKLKKNILDKEFIMEKPIVKLKLVDWWCADTEEEFYNNVFVRLLQRKYHVVYTDKPDFIIYGPFGHKHLTYDCVRIFYTGENIRPDFNIADYAIGFDYVLYEDRYIRAPLFWLYLYHTSIKHSDNHNMDIFNKKTKFCGFVASNGHYLTEMRDNFFDALCSYKQVDSGGRWKNNIGGNIANKIEWLQSYKFNLCFENSSYPGYLTEKLFDAFAAGCVPIYWGDTSLRCHKNANNIGINTTILQDIKDIETKGEWGQQIAFDMRIPNIPTHLLEYEINPKAFINAHNFPTFKELIDEIKRIDNDDKAFREMLQEPVFLHDFQPREFYDEKVFQFLDYIVSQGPIYAKRRGEGQHLQSYRDFLREAAIYKHVSSPFLQYCLRHKNIIEAIHNITTLPRNILRRIRGK